MRKYKIDAANAANSTNTPTNTASNITTNNIIIDYKYLSQKLQEHRESYDKNHKFDMIFLRSEEKTRDIRYVDIKQNGDDFHARFYQRTANGGFTTGITKIKDFKNHDTTLKHVTAICELVGERASNGPGKDADALTVAACNSISDRNGVLKRVSAATAYLNEFV